MSRPYRQDFIGRRFGRLVVVAEAVAQVTPSGQRKRRVACLCDCGSETVVGVADLVSGHQLGCGCFRNDMLIARNTTHGDIHSPEYRAWASSIQRCENPNGEYYRDYGGRGIKVCARWRKSYPNFLADMGRKPTRAHSLDRYPNNDGDYEPSNCRWATAVEQQNNRRDSEARQIYKVGDLRRRLLAAPGAVDFAKSYLSIKHTAHRRIVENFAHALAQHG
jgi:hypothetical protein